TRLLGEWAAARSRRRSSGIHCEACYLHNPRRRCIHTSRSAPAEKQAGDPCRNIRSWAAIPKPLLQLLSVISRRPPAAEAPFEIGESVAGLGTAMEVDLAGEPAHGGCRDHEIIEPIGRPQVH